MVYFPANFPVEVNPAGKIEDAASGSVQNRSRAAIAVAHSDSRKYMAILKPNAIHLWISHPLTLIATYKRSEESLSEYGENNFITWGSADTVLAVGTALGYLLFFKVNAPKEPMTLKQGSQRVFTVPAADLAVFEPPVMAFKSSTAVIRNRITTIVSRQDEIIVATTAGVLERFSWASKQFDAAAAIVLSNLKFSTPPTQISESGVHVVSMSFKTQLKCLGFALSDGRAGIIMTSNFSFAKQMCGHWAVSNAISETVKATSVALNARFRLLAVGYNTGDVAVYSIENPADMSHILVFSHVVSQFTTISGIERKKSGFSAVSTIVFTEDGFAMAVGWRLGGVRVWSVFGSSLMSSADESTNEALESPAVDGVLSLSWGPLGYHLIAISENSPRVMKFEFVKSAVANNSTLSNQFGVALQGDSQIYISPNVGDSRAPRNVEKLLDLQWETLQAPTTYLDQNWPIRFVAVGPQSQYIAIAGQKGVAHYSAATRKWRLFGNQTQEQALQCVGGIVWWQCYLIVSCRTSSGQYEVRFFPREANLDNRHMTHVQMISREVMLLNVCGDRLVVYTSGRRVLVFWMSIGAAKETEFAPVQLELECDIDLKGYVPHSCNVLSVSVNESRQQTAADGADSAGRPMPSSLVVNVSGKILMFLFESESNSFASEAQLLATGVENYWAWAPSVCSKVERHYDALWFGCGGQGMKVWLPLHPDPAEPTEDMSKSVMLPFKLDIYPLSVLFADAVILGGAHDVHHFSSSKLPCYALQRKTQVYLHHILRQLLRRSQDDHAWYIAETCQDLPYFSHVMELMLHEVLEDEAEEEIDPENAQLPRVAQFMQRFPNFLENVVHCARKTEIAKWAYLFSVVGDAKSLFEECIKQKKFSTASSYLIILQSLESPTESAKHAVRILKLALKDQDWDLAKDLVRFLQATSNYIPPKHSAVGSVFSVSEAPPPTYSEVFAEYALELLKSHRVRALGMFAGSLPFPLLAWLKSIRTSEGLALDFSAALQQLYFDFPISCSSPGTNSFPTTPNIHNTRKELSAIEDSMVAVSEIV